MKQPSEPGEPKDLGRTIIEGVVKSDPAQDLGLELGEIGLDQLLDEGVWRDVPALSTVVGIVKTIGNIRDRLFVKKVASFLLACPKFTESEREGFAREHLSDPKKTKKLGDTLVLILDRLDDLEKPLMLTKVFTALVRRKISSTVFRRLAVALDLGFKDDLTSLAGKPFLDLVKIHESLLRTGLVQIDNSGFRLGVAGGTNTDVATYSLSILGHIFIHCMNETYHLAPSLFVEGDECTEEPT
jgi:hypothetical protein